MDLQKGREAFENHLKKMGKTDNETFSKNEDDSYQMDIIHFGWKIWQAAIARMEVRINTLDEMLLNQGKALAQAKAQADQKVKLLLCDEHLKKCESPTGIFNSQYPDEEPCLICLAKEAKAQAVPEQVLKNHCMVGQTWFMEGTPVSALIKHAESVYKAEVIAQNSKIEFGTDDNEHWFAHDVPFYGTVQIDRIEEHGLVEWDIYFNGCWQGTFGSKSECIKHLEGCIAEEHEEAQEPAK